MTRTASTRSASVRVAMTWATTTTPNSSFLSTLTPSSWSTSPAASAATTPAAASTRAGAATRIAGSGWRASGWLGLLTAGSLWTRLQDDSNFEENIRAVQGQIHQVIGDMQHDDEGLDEVEVSPGEAKEELDRLRDDLVSKTEVRFLTEILDDFRQFVDEIWRF